MSTETELPEAGKTSNVKSLWKRGWRKVGEIVVLTITLILTYYFLVLWGVIALVLAGIAKAGDILRKAATRK